MSICFGATEILPGLWIGDSSASNDTTFLKDKQILAIICCARSVNHSTSILFRAVHHVSLADYYTPNQYPAICQQLDTYCALIYNLITNYNVLIYCDNGYQFAPVLLTMYLMKCGKMSVSDVIQCLKTKRTDIDKGLKNYLQLFSFYGGLLTNGTKSHNPVKKQSKFGKQMFP